ncbi:hypothetical protein J2T50_002134 [Streptococcus gallinaceus]|uniref:hypothetical protein n=1 Tax=Streptococcus gallinaceus TaxID=165758 RepID=UPI0020A1F7A3|nr:hypothetical protein [Streptococcus gallinaceus]MCP1640395.1 hypothetical protein [Streptococcus gallinaceus]MCP1771178.1 hypothetical protein [Streptococcus gallinaceus]
MVKYIFSKNFFFRNAGLRLDDNIKRINCLIEENYQKAHDYFKAQGNLQPLDKVPKARLTNIKVSESNNSIVGKIRKLKLTEKNPHFIPEVTAWDIVDNVVLEKEEQKYLFRGQLYRKKRYYKDVQEVYWGTLEELQNKELLFFYVICRDMLNSKMYRELIEGALKDYIPYAKVLAYRDIELNEEFNYPYDKLFPEIEYDTVVTVQDEAITRFYLLYIANKIDVSKLFYDSLQEPIQYWSGQKSIDTQKIERVRKSKSDFSRFDGIFARFLKEDIKPIFERYLATSSSFGFRVYSIIRNDALELANLFSGSIDGQPISDSDFQNAENLISISNNYAYQLELQQRNVEDIDLSIADELVLYKQTQDELIKIDVEDSDDKYVPIEKLIEIYKSRL